MTTFTTFKLNFTSPLHLSRGKMDTYESSDTILHSDTLKSAIYVAARQVCGEAWAEHFMHDIRLSSAFPFDASGYYLPMPLSYHPNVDAEERKEFKKVKYLTINQFETIAQGGEPQLLTGEGKAKQPKIWEHDTTQRVKINYEEDSTPFYLEKLYPRGEGTGLYFMVDNLSDDDAQKLEDAICFLSYSGIGLQRNLGNGRFEYEKGSMNINLPTNAKSWVNLSLYRPKDAKELNDEVLEKGNYQFKKRGGWVSSPEVEANISLRKKSIMMFTEGSVFPFESINNKGFVEDVKPDISLINHSIWRDGKAIFLPILV